MSNISDKYGTWSTKYYLVDEKTLTTDSYSRKKKTISLPVLFDMIDSDHINNVKLVYYKELGIIKGIVNGEQKFSINFLREDQENLMNGTYGGNKYLEELIARTIDGEEYDSLKVMERESRAYDLLPADPVLLDKYRNYIESRIADLRSKQYANLIESYWHVLMTSCAIATRFASRLTMNLSDEASMLLLIGSSVMHIAATYSATKLLINNRIPSIIEESKDNNWQRKQYEQELEDINNGGLEGRKRKIRNGLRKDFYDTIKVVAKLVNKIPEEFRDEYFNKIKAIVNKYNKEMKEATDTRDFRQAYIEIFNECYEDFDDIIKNIKESGLIEEPEQEYNSLYAY